MSRVQLDGQKLFDSELRPTPTMSSTRQAISGAFTVSKGMGPVLVLDPTGAQNVTFPTKGSKFTYWLFHGNTNNAALTLKDSTGANLVTVNQGKSAMVVDDGVTTMAMLGA